MFEFIKTVKHDQIDISNEVSEFTDIIPGINRFGTRFNTLFGYLSNYKFDAMDKDINDIEFDNIEGLLNYLSWDNLNIDKSNFKYVKDLGKAILKISDCFPLYDPFDCDMNNDTKSFKMYIKDHDSDHYKYKFDFYKVPGRINTVLENMGYGTASLLDDYINDRDKEDLEFLCIDYENNDLNFNTSITVPVTNNIDSDIEDTVEEIDYNKILLESIMIETYKICKDSYENIIKTIISRYFHISISDLDKYYTSLNTETNR